MAGCVPQPHTCGTPVYLTLFFSLLRRCRLTAQGVGKIKQGHSSAFPPSAEECMLPFASSSRTSRKLRTCLGSPLLAQLGSHLGLASGPFFSGTQPFLPDLLPSEFRASGRLLFSTQLSLSPFRLLPTQSHHTTGNLPSPLSLWILHGAFPPLAIAPLLWGPPHPSACCVYSVSSVFHTHTIYTPSYFIPCLPSPARVWVRQGQPFFPSGKRSVMGLFHNDPSKFIRQSKESLNMD